MHVHIYVEQTSILAACVRVHSFMTVQEVRGSTPGTDSYNSGFHYVEVDK